MTEQALVVTDPIPLVPKDALDIIEIRNKTFEKVLAVAIAATGPADWVDMQGKPYLQGSGAEKVARRFGVKWFDTEIEREDLEDELGKYYVYTVMGKSSFGDRETIEAIGTCSSRDRFFGREQGKLKKTQDVDLPNIKKKAYTNFIVNAVTKLLGLRNLTWEELEKYGIRKLGKSAVRFNSEVQKVESSNKIQNDAIQAKGPFWISDHDGKTYIFAKVGRHFSQEFLVSHGFKVTKTSPDKFFKESNEQTLNLLKKEFNAIEGGHNE